MSDVPVHPMSNQITEAMDKIMRAVKFSSEHNADPYGAIVSSVTSLVDKAIEEGEILAYAKRNARF